VIADLAEARSLAIVGHEADSTAESTVAGLELATTLTFVDELFPAVGSEVCPLAGLDRLKVAEAAITATKTGDKRIVFT
jgi:hypothetical protein